MAQFNLVEDNGRNTSNLHKSHSTNELETQIICENSPSITESENDRPTWLSSNLLLLAKSAVEGDQTDSSKEKEGKVNQSRSFNNKKVNSIVFI